MREVLAKFLLMVAVLFMPFGMAAPAAAAAHHFPPSASAMQLRPDERATPHAKSGIGECARACATALPALDPSADRQVPLVAAPAPRRLAAPLTGLHPETATPPPRRA